MSFQDGFFYKPEEKGRYSRFYTAHGSLVVSACNTPARQIEDAAIFNCAVCVKVVDRVLLAVEIEQVFLVNLQRLVELYRSRCAGYRGQRGSSQVCGWRFQRCCCSFFISPIHAFCVVVPPFKCADAAFAVCSVWNGIQRQTAFLSGLPIDQCDFSNSFKSFAHFCLYILKNKENIQRMHWNTRKYRRYLITIFYVFMTFIPEVSCVRITLPLPENPVKLIAWLDFFNV